MELREIKALKMLDNGALLTSAYDVLELIVQEAPEGSHEWRRALSALEALAILEDRESFKSIKDRKD